MPETPESNDTLRQAGALIAARQDGTPAPLADTQRTAVQDATLAIVQSLRGGKTPDQIEQDLAQVGWQPTLAAGFIRLVSQLLARMYLVRTGIAVILTLLSGMLASILVSMAQGGEFSWLTAGLVTFIAIVCLLTTLRNFQLWRRFKAVRGP